jgi:hypothetical protein
VQSSFYWSSTTNAYDTYTAWDVSFYGGVVRPDDKGDNGAYVWPVRGGH